MSENTPTAAASPPTEESVDKPVEIHYLDIDRQSIRDAARDRADKILTERINESGGFRGAVRRLWYGELARDYYAHKLTRQEERKIVESQNIYAGLTDDKKVHEAALRSTVARFTSGNEHMVEEEAGEFRRDISDSLEAPSEGLRNVVRELVSRYATGELDEDSFQEEKVRHLQALNESSEGALGEGLMYADNILEIAQTLKLAHEHGQAIETILDNAKFYVGRARLGVRTEAHYSKVDKTVDKLQKASRGWLNETTLAAAASIAYSVGKFGFRSAAAAAGATAGIGLAAGTVAGVRESKAIKDERRQHHRERAQGYQIEDGSQRREELEETLYSAKTARQLREAMGTAAHGENIGSTASFLDTLQAVSEATARQVYSARFGVDLISYSAPTNVETERYELLEAVAKTRQALQSYLENMSVEERNEHSLLANDIESIIADYVDAAVVEFDTDKTSKDRVFKNLKRKAVAKAVAKGTLIGLAVGTTIQESAAFFTDSKEGLVQSWLFGAGREANDLTLLRGMIGGHEFIEEQIQLGTQTVELADNLYATIPEGYEIKPGTVGYDIFDGEGNIVHAGLQPGESGFTASQITALEDSGINANFESSLIETEQTALVNAQELVANHHEEMTTVRRELWYDNNTPGRSTLNELRLWWGGEGNSGITANGDFAFSVSHMTENGSFHGGFSANWQELANNGELHLAVSVSVDTQTEVFMLPIDASGNVVIEQGSPAATLFQEQNGEAIFNGAYVEVVHSPGAAEDGVSRLRILATHIGEQQQQFTTTLPVPEEHMNMILDVVEQEVTAQKVLVAPVLPLYGRRGLESVILTTEDEGVVAPYYYAGWPELDRESLRDYISERLYADPDAELDPAVEIPDYFERQSEEYIEQLNELATQVEDLPLPQHARAVVVIPVAGHQEGGNIYRTLEAYTEQTAASDQFAIQLFVNHPDVDPDGNPLSAQETLSEISRFQADYPDLTVDVVYGTLPRNQARIGRIRKLAVDTLLRRMQKQDLMKEDMIIVGNDADAHYITPEYIANFIEKFTNDKEADGYLGLIDWDLLDSLRNPVLYVGNRLMDNINARSRHSGYVGSSGANFAIRASCYAAVGGYREGVREGEDVIIGRTVKAARKGSERTPIKFAGTRNSRIVLSVRRAAAVWEQEGRSPIGQWHGSFTPDDEYRQREEGQLFVRRDYDDPQVRKELMVEFEAIINHTLETIGHLPPESSAAITPRDATRIAATTRRLLRNLSIEYEIDSSGRVKLISADILFKRLGVIQKRLLDAAQRDIRLANDLFAHQRINAENEQTSPSEQNNMSYAEFLRQGGAYGEGRRKRFGA